MRVWVHQDLCTSDGLCTDHRPDVFVLIEDGISYVRHPTGSPGTGPGGRWSVVDRAVANSASMSIIQVHDDTTPACAWHHDRRTSSRPDHVAKETVNPGRPAQLVWRQANSIGMSLDS